MKGSINQERVLIRDEVGKVRGFCPRHLTLCQGFLLLIEGSREGYLSSQVSFSSVKIKLWPILLCTKVNLKEKKLYEVEIHPF